MRRARPAQDRWIRSFVGLYLEVEAGLRPLRHLRPLLHEDLLPVVGRCGRQGRTPRVVRVLSQHRGPATEAVVLLDDGARVDALAVAVRLQGRRWHVTDVRRPDAIVPPDPTPAGPTATPVPWVDPDVHLPRPSWTVPAGWARPAA